ncbi:thioredoxin-like protein 1 [Rhopilema esculentum]|uniref:thioredoxin-like protein 1 n=1 Tax=Rhopilema esculentum TaxID=499914 RepID=UPI0031DA550B
MATNHGNVKIIADDSQFQPELSNAGSKLVVVDFHATWCGPCLKIGPTFVKFSTKYNKAVFLKVDVDQCADVAAKYGITAMPTFLFFKNKVKIDEMRGADEASLEKKIKQHIGDEGGEDDVGVAGHVDLGSFISMAGCACLNESDENTFQNALKKGPTYLESDCDEELLLTISFTQPVKLHSVKIAAPDDGRGPKTIKIFKNQPSAIDFDQAKRMEALQTLNLSSDDIDGNQIIELRYVKFQDVQNIIIFVQDNQGGEETTVIGNLTIIGSPSEATKMSDFKRVAGKAGESH